jgi:hypothetical protein
MFYRKNMFLEVMTMVVLVIGGMEVNISLQVMWEKTDQILSYVKN